MNLANLGRAVVLILVLFVSFSSGCKSGGGSDDGGNPFGLGKATGGVFVVDFQTLQDFLDHPTGQLILANMPRHLGNTPPNVEGTYEAWGEVADSTIPGSEIADKITAQFCFGTPAGGVIDVRISRPTIAERALASFIEGNGNAFTIFTVFRSVFPLAGGEACDVIEVNVISGQLGADGGLRDLVIGIGIVGLTGDCAPLLIDDAEIRELTALRLGPGCVDVPAEPNDADRVLVVVDNFLLSDVELFEGAGGAAPVLEVGAASSGFFETLPGPRLSFESIRPVVGGGGGGLGAGLAEMGEILTGSFGTIDPKSFPAGSTVVVQVDNLIGNDFYFAPRPRNLGADDLYAVVNSSVASLDFFPYEPPFGSGLDCGCVMAPSTIPYDIGYYSYHVEGTIQASQANLRFFRESDNAPVASFIGPFDIDAGAGTVVLDVGGAR